jgi:hypothetical protein
LKVKLKVPLVIILFLVLVSSGQTLPTGTTFTKESGSVTEASAAESQLSLESSFSTSAFDDTIQGIMDPALIEQRGFTISDNMAARTDNLYNLSYDFSIDQVHNWTASQANVSVWDITRMYAINGTFDEGYSGVNIYPDGSDSFYPLNWMSNSTNETSPQQTWQRSSYEASGKYVTVENEGAKDAPSHNNEFAHYQGTMVLWEQTIQRVSTVEDFILSFDYLYFKGPLGSVVGNCSLQVLINSTSIWNQSLLVLPSRGVWYNTGDIAVNVPNGGTQFDLSVGLVIDEDMFLDYGILGTENSANITAFLDDISLTGISPPTPAEVDLGVTVGSIPSQLTGAAEIGSATVTNVNYWKTHPLTVEFNANSSISFMYNISLLNHRFTNSTWTTNINNEGVFYSAEVGVAPELEMFTYIGFLSDYQNLTLRATFPMDWSSIEIFDPFLTDVTGQCTIGAGYLEIPGNLLSLLGWWKITLDSPNYADLIEPQIQDDSTGEWSNELVFRSGNTSRVAVSIQTLTEIPSILNDVNVTWIYPNGSLWSTELIDGGFSGEINSSSRVFGTQNATAGEWSTYILWENGTEIAYDMVQYDLHHEAQLVAVNDVIETEVGMVVTNFVQFIDSETSEYIMDPTSTVVANWSGFTLTFNPIDVYNWWEVSLDTSIIGAGEFAVRVNATGQYFDDAYCTFIIRAIHKDNEVQLRETAAEIGLHEHYIAFFEYKDSLGVGIDDANFSISYTGPANGISWGANASYGLGNYSIDFTALSSGTYSITISASKEFYEASDDTLFLLVGEINTDLSVSNGSSAIIQFSQAYRLFVEYENSSGYGLSGANISVASVFPEFGLSIGNTLEEGNGLYSILLTPMETGTYTIIMEANLSNHRTQFQSFTLTASPIGSVLTLLASSEIIDLDETVTLHMTFKNETDYGIVGATISIVDPPEGLSFSNVSDLGNGNYSIVITPLDVGLYQLLIRASMTNHIDDSAAYNINVNTIESTLSNLDPFECWIGIEKSITITYATLRNSTGITDAIIFIQGEVTDWISIVSLGNGSYSTTIDSDAFGGYTIYLTFRRDGFESHSIELSFTVVRIPLRIQASPITWTQGSPLTFSVTVLDEAEGNPVSGLEVECVLLRNGIETDFYDVLTELSSGTYGTTLNADWGESLFEVLINVDGVNHVLNNHHLAVSTEADFVAGMLYEFQKIGTPLGIIVFFIVLGFVSLRTTSSRKRKHYAEAWTVKKRFEDAENILGVIVLHKLSGLPVYSKMLKGGFEEGMLSAFITAIAHFRSEFETLNEEEDFKPVPISDIIRSISTKNLICAFITMTSASVEQEARMIMYARTVGMMFDELYDGTPSQYREEEAATSFDALFDWHLDGTLLKEYKISAGRIPRKFRNLIEASEVIGVEGVFRLTALARKLASEGMAEEDAFLLVVKAVADKILVPAEPIEIGITDDSFGWQLMPED